MPARVVVVLDEPELAETVAAALRAVCSSIAFADPMEALEALEEANVTDLLITSTDFAPGKPNGVALALMVRNRRQDEVKVLFVGPLEMDHLVAGLGGLVPTPANGEQIAERAKQMLEQPDEPAEPAT